MSTDIAPEDIDPRNRERDACVLTAARRILLASGLASLNRHEIAKVAGVSPASVSNFGRSRITNGTHERRGYRERILAGLMDEATAERDLRLIRIGVADGCVKPDDLPASIRTEL